jgi:hypothetical protein
VSLVCGRVVQSGVASRVYLLGVVSLGVIRLVVALVDDGFASSVPDDAIPDDAMPDNTIWVFARSVQSRI